MSYYEQAEDAITEDYNNGDISLEEYNQQMRELQRQHREEAEDAASDAYNREMENW